MLKKVVSLCLVLCMTVSLMITGYAKSSDIKISSDTVITKDNIYDVLDYLGLDSSKLELSADAKANKVTSSKVKVGDLEKAIEKVKNQSTEPISSRSYSSSATGNSLLSTSSIILNTTLYHESVYSNYTITQSCSGTYQIGVSGWLSCGGGSITADASFPYTIKITNNPTITTGVSADKSNIYMIYSNLKVTIYYGIGDVGLVPLNSYTYNGSCSWAASEFATT